MRVGDSDSGLMLVSECSMGNQKLEYCDTERDLGVQHRGWRTVCLQQLMPIRCRKQTVT